MRTIIVIGWLVAGIARTVLAQSTNALAPQKAELIRALAPLSVRGVNYYPRETPWGGMWTKTPAEVWERDMALAASLRVNTVRTFVTFAPDLEQAGLMQGDGAPTPAYLAKMEALLSAAWRNGVRVILCFDFTPESLASPAAESRWRKALSAVVGAHREDGRVLMWDLMNEPEDDAKWTDGTRAYLKAAIPFVKQLDTNHLTTVGIAYRTDRLAEVGLPDVLQYHEYSPKKILFEKGLARVGEDIANQGGVGKPRPLIIGEFGMCTARDPQFGAEASLREKIAEHPGTEAEQKRIYEIVLEAAEESRIAGVMPWCLYDYPIKNPNESHFGLVRSDGTLKPAAEVLRKSFGKWERDQSETVQIKSVVAETLRPGRNLLVNPGFEQTRDNGIPDGWQWDRRNTDAACLTDRAVAHRGGCSLRITNGTEFGAHVFGMLWNSQPVRLEEGKTYTISLWVKSEAPGTLSVIGGRDWQIRLPLVASGGQWRRVWKAFTPAPQDCDFTLRISTESPTQGAWIDDVKLEEGSAPTVDAPDGMAGARATLEPDDADYVVQGDGAFSLDFTLITPRAAAGTWTAALGSGETFRQPAAVEAGVWRVQVKGAATAGGDAPRRVTLSLEEAGQERVTALAQVRFYSASNALERLAALKARLPALRETLGAVKASGQDLSYPLVTATVLENFVGYAEEDARGGEVRRSLEQVGDLEAMAVRLARELEEARSGQRRFPAVPRWTGESRPVVKGSSFLAPVRIPGDVTMERPVFFNGFGHFGQVVDDMEKWPGYGANIIQIEVGPSAVFPAEGQTNDAPVRWLLQTLDRAQKSGVAVCLLISPHYMPEWALQKWPHLKKQRTGFLQYCLHAPEGQELMRRFIATLIPPIKDHPALHSICLSNEPVNEEEPCEPARQLWQAWLEKRHGNVTNVNALCGSTFATFAEVPLPSSFGPRPAQALWIDYLRFNQEFFADWHKRMADAVHAVAPGLPVHAKAMTWTLLNDGDIKFGVDATLFGRFSDINGNDAVNFYTFGVGEFAQDWQMNAMGHDLQRSVLDAPVFNTENHLIADRDTRYVPAAHIRAGLWQAAVHGQSATTIWVWGRTFDPKNDFAGSIMHRPACTEAVGFVNHDLNRAAREITAIQQARPQALLVQSVTAVVWDGGGYTECLGKLYTALSFTGLKPGFITERQLEAGVVPEAPAVFIPGITHFSDAALATLRRFTGRLVFIGEGDLLTHDEFGRPRASNLTGDKIGYRQATTSARALHVQIMARLPAWNLRPAVELRAADAQPAWGVEWRSAETCEGTLVNLCNYERTPVALTQGGQAKSARDVLTGARVEWPLTLAPLEIRLLRLEHQ